MIVVIGLADLTLALKPHRILSLHSPGSPGRLITIWIWPKQSPLNPFTSFPIRRKRLIFFRWCSIYFIFKGILAVLHLRWLFSSDCLTGQSICPYQKTITVHDDYNCPLSMVSKSLAAPAQHLKLQTCGIYPPTTKGLHKGDMSRNWLWFDIETSQRKDKLLWLLEKDPKHPVTPGNNGEDASQFMHYHDSSPLGATILGSLPVSLTAQWS